MGSLILANSEHAYVQLEASDWAAYFMLACTVGSWELLVCGMFYMLHWAVGDTASQRCTCRVQGSFELFLDRLEWKRSEIRPALTFKT